MKNRIKELARELYEQEYSAKEAAVELVGQASQSSIYRWFDEFEGESDFLSGVVDNEDSQEETDTDLGIEGPGEDEESIEDDLSDLAGIDDEEDDLAEVDDEVTEVLMDEDNEITLRKSKRGIEKKMKKLFNAIFSHSSGHEWSNSQLKRMLRSMDSIQDQIENIFDYNSESFRANAYWVYLDSFIDLFQSFVNAGGDVEIDFVEKISDEMSAVLSIEEFDTEYVWGDIFEDEFSRLKNDLKEIDGQKLDADKAYDYESRIGNLVAELEGNDSESAYTNEMSTLKGLKKDFKQLSVTIEESFWGNATFELDPDFQS